MALYGVMMWRYMQRIFTFEDLMDLHTEDSDKYVKLIQSIFTEGNDDCGSRT